MAVVGKLIFLSNLLARKTTWSVLTTTSATLILSRDFIADCMTRIAYIYSRLSFFSFSTHRDNTFIYTALTETTHSFPFWLPETTHSLSNIWLPAVNPTKCILSATIFFLVLSLQLDLLQPPKQPQKFRQTTKRNKRTTWKKTRFSEHT